MWTVITTNIFDKWFDQQTDDMQEKILAGLVALQKGGSGVGRPLVDTVNASKFKNMKELRIQHKGDPLRAFLLLIQLGKQSYYARVIKAAMKRDFINK